MNHRIDSIMIGVPLSIRKDIEWIVLALSAFDEWMPSAQRFS